MAEQKTKMVLPDLAKTNEPIAPTTEKSTTIPSNNFPKVTSEISTKQMMITGGALLVAVILFIFIKNAVSKMLVASYRKSPRSADMAGWSLFSFLFFSSMVAALGVLDSTRLLSLPYLVPLGLAMLISLIMFIVALLSKR